MTGYIPPTECLDNDTCPYPLYAGVIRNLSGRKKEWFYRREDYPFTYIIDCKDVDPEIDENPFKAKERLMAERKANNAAKAAAAVPKPKGPIQTPPTPFKAPKVIDLELSNNPFSEKKPPLEKKNPFQHKPQWLNKTPISPPHTEPIALPAGYKTREQLNNFEKEIQPALTSLDNSLHTLTAWAQEVSKKQVPTQALMESAMKITFQNTEAIKANTLALNDLSAKLDSFCTGFTHIANQMEMISDQLTSYKTTLPNLSGKKRYIDVEHETSKSSKKQNLSSDEDNLFFGHKLTSPEDENDSICADAHSQHQPVMDE
jgi:hypothetical protein